ncbi:FRG domain-containing protein [Azospirillum sp. Marseille-Q6669]
MPVERREVDGLDGLLKETLAIAQELSPSEFLWFRGVNLGKHKLLPKIMRDGKSSDEVFDRERRLLTRFRQRSIAYWPAGYPQNDWEHLFAMQHFGMPTRLLDWSENLFVAAHFALGLMPQENERNESPPVIWCVNPIIWNRSTPALSDFGESIQVLTTSDEEIEAYQTQTNKRRNKFPVAIFGTHNSNRIVAQRGTFMVWGSDVRALEEFAEEVPAKLWRIQINGNRDDLAEALNVLGFGETMVFPELPSLASELSRVEGWRK